MTDEEAVIIFSLPCSDSRNDWRVLLQSRDVTGDYGILESASIAQTPPPDFGLTLRGFNNPPVMITVHEPCGGRSTKEQIEGGVFVDPPALHHWVDTRVHSHDQYELSESLVNQVHAVAPDVEIVVLWLNNATQILRPMGYFIGPEVVYWPEPDEIALMPSSDWPGWLKPIIEANSDAAELAAATAQRYNYAAGQSFSRVVCTSSHLPVTSMPKFWAEARLDTREIEGDVAFRVYFPREHPQWAVDQLWYAYDRMPTHGEIFFIAHASGDLNRIIQAHFQEDRFEQLVREKNLVIHSFAA